jgi:hypothetical protein
MTTVAVCAAVFTASIFLSIRLAKFIANCDRREADLYIVAEAERIVREAAAIR